MFPVESDSVEHFRQKTKGNINAFRKCLRNELDNVILPLYKTVVFSCLLLCTAYHILGKKQQNKRKLKRGQQGTNCNIRQKLRDQNILKAREQVET